MTARPQITLIICTFLALCVATTALAQPEPVPRLVERQLDRASYTELARQWKQYIEEHGETADALVNLGMAYDYSEEQEAALIAARRAVEIGPDHPRALEFLGKMLATYGGDREGALEVLLHCREVAPDYKYGLTMLATTHLFRGELSEADAVFEVVFNQGAISRPLQDYAYNMLVGLPKGAVLITGGDTDTYGPLALQAGMEFRKDVVVLNRSLLNVVEFASAVFERHPSLMPEYNIEEHETTIGPDGEATLLSIALIEAMIAEDKAPVYITSSAANVKYHGFQPDGPIEGVNIRTRKKGMSTDESARLFLETYRLDSATDWGFAWALVPGVRHQLQNYVTSIVKLSEQEGLSKKTRAKVLEKASTIAEFHEMDKMTMYIRKLQKK